ncbi:MAG: hypothetical protein GQ557_00600 [Mycoplasmataceae bacterium]|nr:hypothetical protein [Mycoplasmataceae bacterium]
MKFFINRKIKIMLFDEKGDQLKTVLDLLKNDKDFMKKIKFYSLDSFIPKFQMKHTRNNNSKLKIFLLNYSKQKFLDQMDLILSHSWLAHYYRGYKKSQKSPLHIDFFHGTLAKNPAKFLHAKSTTIDYILSPDEYTTNVLKKYGWKDEKILKFGYPRMDFYDQLLKTSIDHIWNIVLPARNKDIILFCPTWIGYKVSNPLTSESFGKDDKILKSLNSKMETKHIDERDHSGPIIYDLNPILKNIDNNEILVNSFHDNLGALGNVKFSWDEIYNDKILQKRKDFEQIPSWMIMLISKKLITDYSSIIFDYVKLFPNKDNYEFYQPDKDMTQDEFTIKIYAKYYKTWGNGLIPDIHKINLNSKEFKSYADDYKVSSTILISNFIKDKVNKKNLKDFLN